MHKMRGDHSAERTEKHGNKDEGKTQATQNKNTTGTTA